MVQEELMGKSEGQGGVAKGRKSRAQEEASRGGTLSRPKAQENSNF